MVRRPLAAVIALLAGLVPAIAQVPSTLPPNTVVGRAGISAGPPQAIPFINLFNSILAGQSPGCLTITASPVGSNTLGCLPAITNYGAVTQGTTATNNAAIVR